MIENELIKIWQSSSKQEQIKFEKSRLILEMDNGLDRFKRVVKYRILIDQIGTISMIPALLFSIYFVPPILAKIAMSLIFVWLIWYAFQLRNATKRKPGSVTLNYLEYLKKTKDFIIYLKKTLVKMIYSYTLLAMPAYFLSIAGVYFDEIISISHLIIFTLVGVVGHIAAYIYSIWEVKKISQQSKSINTLIKVMEE